MNKNFKLDILLFVSGLICIVTGIILDFHLVPGGKEFRHIFKNVHIYSGYIMAVGIIFHIAWHKNFIRAALKIKSD